MIIYKTTNLVNGKQYIGKDKRNNPNYLGSGTILRLAIRKHGKQNFKKEILEVCSSNEELIEREEYWLNFYDAGGNDMFYNMHNHSHGGRIPSNKTRQKTSEALLRKKKSEEHKKRISAGRRGIVFSNETRKKMSVSHTGKTASKETRKKMSNARLGKLNYWHGKTFTDEHRKKLSQSHIGNSSNFRGYVVCVDGIHRGELKTSKEWSEILGVSLPSISRHLSGKRCKNGIRGNILKWENQL